jgi:hypothetical protein
MKPFFLQWHYVLVLTAAGAAAVAGYLRMAGPASPADYAEAGRPPRIDPDYSGCTLPPNIAPLNFQIKERGRRYRVRVAASDEELVVAGKDPCIVFPPSRWRNLLEKSRGGRLAIDVFVQGEDGQWMHFDTIANDVAREKLDPYVVYRRIGPVHNIFVNMGTYQRNIENFEESPILQSGPESGRCVNCHAFGNNRPDRMLFHIRKNPGPVMLLVKDGKPVKIDTRTKLHPGPGSYPAWHPSGLMVAFSINNPTQWHHAVGDSRDVFDYGSELAVYDLRTQTLFSSPKISDPDYLETLPAWSPDGKYLYFSRAERKWPADAKQKNVFPLAFDKVRYDLCRIAFDMDQCAWGKLETLLSAEETGLSINEPRVSPDGRFLLFCMHDYGSFPVFQRSSDLYMMDLQTHRYWKLDINSDRSDSWHCWSSNGRWIVFASKRRDGVFGRLYFSYVDAEGKARKPILLPQEDPKFYDSFLENFNVPELIEAPVSIDQRMLLEAIASDAEKPDDGPGTP